MVLQLKPCQRNCWAFLRGSSSFIGLSWPTKFPGMQRVRSAWFFFAAQNFKPARGVTAAAQNWATRQRQTCKPRPRVVLAHAVQLTGAMEPSLLLALLQIMCMCISNVFTYNANATVRQNRQNLERDTTSSHPPHISLLCFKRGEREKMPQQNDLEFPRHFLSLKISDASDQHFVAERNLGFDAA